MGTLGGTRHGGLLRMSLAVANITQPPTVQVRNLNFERIISSEQEFQILARHGLTYYAIS